MGAGRTLSVYAESSAVLGWLLGEKGTAGRVSEALAAAERVVTSRLTLIECRRVITRAEVAGWAAPARAADARRDLERASAHWTVFEIDEHVSEQASRPFPVEPVRTLDAIHMGTALVACAAVPGLVVLSLDERIRRNVRSLGFELVID